MQQEIVWVRCLHNSRNISGIFRRGGWRLGRAPICCRESSKNVLCCIVTKSHSDSFFFPSWLTGKVLENIWSNICGQLRSHVQLLWKNSEKCPDFQLRTDARFTHLGEQYFQVMLKRKEIHQLRMGFKCPHYMLGTNEVNWVFFQVQGSYPIIK